MKPRVFDFNKPEEARLFLVGLKYRGRKMTFIVAGGVEYHFDRLDDEQASRVATTIYQEVLMGRIDGVRWTDEELH